MHRTNLCPNCGWVLPRRTQYKSKKNNPFSCPDCGTRLRYVSIFDKYMKFIAPLFVLLYFWGQRYLNEASTGFADKMQKVGVFITPFIVLFIIGLLTMPWTDKLIKLENNVEVKNN